MKKVPSKNNFPNRPRSAFTFFELAVALGVIILLIGVVLQGRKIIDLSRISRARTLTKNSPAATTAGLVLWIETTSKDSLSNSLRDGDQVSVWNDINPQLSKKKHLSATNFALPTYKKHGINGLPTISYNHSGGNDSCLATDNISSSEISTDAQNTTFLVAKDSNAVSVFVGYSVWPNNSRRLAHLQSDNYRLRSDNKDGPISLIGTSSVTKPFVGSAVRGPSNGYLYFNGQLEATSNDSGSLTPFSARIYFGCWSDLQTDIYNMTGEIGEVLIYNRALSDFERREIEKYLAKKWGIKISQS